MKLSALPLSLREELLLACAEAGFANASSCPRQASEMPGQLIQSIARSMMVLGCVSIKSKLVWFCVENGLLGNPDILLRQLFYFYVQGGRYHIKQICYILYTDIAFDS